MIAAWYQYETIQTNYAVNGPKLTLLKQKKTMIENRLAN